MQTFYTLLSAIFVVGGIRHQPQLSRCEKSRLHNFILRGVCKKQLNRYGLMTSCIVRESHNIEVILIYQSSKHCTKVYPLHIYTSRAHISAMSTYFILPIYFSLVHDGLMHLTRSDQGPGRGMHAAECPQYQTQGRSSGGNHSQVLLKSIHINRIYSGITW